MRPRSASEQVLTSLSCLDIDIVYIETRGKNPNVRRRRVTGKLTSWCKCVVAYFCEELLLLPLPEPSIHPSVHLSRLLPTVSMKLKRLGQPKTRLAP